MNSSNDSSSERYSQNKINTNKQTKQNIYGMGLLPDT